MVAAGGKIAITLVIALLAMSPTIVSSFLYSSSARWSSHRTFAVRCDRPTGGTRLRRGARTRRQELTCGLQITVRIRGKKSREEDYTNQVRGWREVSILMFSDVMHTHVSKAQDNPHVDVAEPPTEAPCAINTYVSNTSWHFGCCLQSIK